MVQVRDEGKKISIDSFKSKVYEVDNMDFHITVESKGEFTGTVLLEFNQGGVSGIEQGKKLKVKRIV
jgi:hypothetical protein